MAAVSGKSSAGLFSLFPNRISGNGQGVKHGLQTLFTLNTCVYIYIYIYVSIFPHMYSHMYLNIVTIVTKHILVYR